MRTRRFFAPTIMHQREDANIQKRIDSPRSGRLEIAQHFSAGYEASKQNQSVKRTTEIHPTAISAVRFADSLPKIIDEIPTDESGLILLTNP